MSDIILSVGLLVELLYKCAAYLLKFIFKEKVCFVLRDGNPG